MSMAFGWPHDGVVTWAYGGPCAVVAGSLRALSSFAWVARLDCLLPHGKSIITIYHHHHLAVLITTSITTATVSITTATVSITTATVSITTSTFFFAGRPPDRHAQGTVSPFRDTPSLWSGLHTSLLVRFGSWLFACIYVFHFHRRCTFGRREPWGETAHVGWSNCQTRKGTGSLRQMLATHATRPEVLV